MSEKKIESIIRDTFDALAKNDVEKTLSYFTEDAVWVAPEGTFKGWEELNRYLTLGVQTIPEKKYMDAGIGIMAKGNKAIWEYVAACVTVDGRRYEVPTVCVYEFSGEKIQQLRAFYDRLTVAKQAAKGWLEKRISNAIVNRMERGLH